MPDYYKYKPTRRSASRYKVYDVEDLAEVIDDILTVYAKNVTEAVKEVTDIVANEVREEIYMKSPDRTGEYRDNWRATNVYDSPLERRTAVHNVNTWRLIHLLEWGHKVANGRDFKTAKRRKDHAKTFVQARPHVMPAYVKGVKLFSHKVKEAIIKANGDT